MTATLTAATTNAAPITSVPMLDVSRENNRLRAELDTVIGEVCRSGVFVHGTACAKLEAAIAKYCGIEYAVGCASGSDALLLPLIALGIGPGDEVVMPSFTFFATAGAVWRLGARPVFVDIDPVTFNMSPGDLIGKISVNTKAIIPVHLFGQCAAIDEIRQIASAARNIPIIEDACQAIGAEMNGRRAGSLGTFGALSFYPTKNLGGFGDGGMITTNDGEMAARLRVLRDHGQQPRYYHHVVGLNSRLDTLQAAVLGVKLPYLEQWTAARVRHAACYEAEFGKCGLGGQLVTPKAAANSRHVWNQYTVRVTGGRRDALQKYLAERQIGSAIYYPVPLHLQKCFATLGYREGSLPVTERVAREVLSLPVYPELTSGEQGTVIEAITTFCQSQSRVAKSTAA